MAIKMYRYQTKDYQNIIGNEGVNAYLKTYLSIEDWVLWQWVTEDRGMFSQLKKEAYG